MPQYISFDDTHIIYDLSDPFGIVAVHFSLLPIYLMVFYTSWFVVTREIEPVVAVGGQLANDVLNKLLKVMFKQPRPDFHRFFGAQSHALNYGMPSAHAQFMGFFATYYIVMTWAATSSCKAFKLLVTLGLTVAAIGVAISRWYLMYHTVEQVLVGVGAGVAAGLSYALVSISVREIGLVDWVLLWRVVRLFWITDLFYHNSRLYKQWEAIEQAKTKKNI